MLQNRFIKISAITLLTAFYACSNETSVEDVEVTNDEQMKEVRATVSFNGTEEINIIHCNGQVDVPPQNMADVHARIDGIVTSVKVLEGDYVTKGQVLAVLDSKSLIDLQSSLVVARANYNNLNAAFNRKLNLYESKSISEKEYQQAKSDFETAEAELKSIESRLKYAGVDVFTENSSNEIESSFFITSPINGFVNAVGLNVGAKISDTDKVFEVIDPSHKHVELAVFAEDASKLKKGQLVTFNTPDGDETFKGYVYLINQAINKETRTVKVHVHPVDEEMPLFVSTFVEASIKTDSTAEIEVTQH